MLMQVVKEESEATNMQSCSKGCGQEETGTIPTGSPPTKPTKILDKSQNVISNTVTPGAGTNPEAK